MEILYNNFEYLKRPLSIFRRMNLRFLAADKFICCIMNNKKHIKVRLSEPVGKGVYLHGVYDLGVSEGILRLTNPTDTFGDIGANVGYTSLLASSIVKSEGQIHAFEPHPETIKELKRNLELNNSRVKIHPYGLSEHSGKASMTVHEEGHRGAAKIGKGGVQVELRRLDDLGVNFNFIKIDVEGHELETLKGLRFTLERVRDMIFEDDKCSTELHSLLSHLGFTLFKIGRKIDGPSLYELPDNERRVTNWEPQNYLATRNPERAIKLFAPRGWRCLH